MYDQQKVGVIIAAAGSSRRMGEADKLFALLGGKPFLLRAIHPFQRCRLIDQIVVVVSKENKKRCQRLISGEEWSKVTDICAGGERRQDSVAAGIKRLDRCGWVIIHDGARPLVSMGLIELGLREAKETGAAIAAVPVTDTIKLVGNDRMVIQTLSRHNLWAVQTPQVFRFDIITEAYHQTKGDVTDDASLVEPLGYKVKLYMGSDNNIKVTTPEDMALAGSLWQRYER